MSFAAFSPETAPADAVRGLARVALSERLSNVARFLALAAENPQADPEHVHQLRVATRRATAGVRLFHDVLPDVEAARMRTLLRRIRRTADAARDDDVLTARLRAEDNAPGVIRLLTRGTAHRQQAQGPIGAIHAELIRGGRFRQQAERMLADLEDGPPPGPADPAAWARRRLRPLARKFRRAAKRCGRDAASLHAFRIRVKSLRYSLELVSPVLPERRVARAIGPLEQLQDLLGAINDHATAETRFRRWLEQSEDAEERAYLEANVEAERKAFRRARRDLRAWWTPRRRRRMQRRIQRVIDT